MKKINGVNLIKVFSFITIFLLHIEDISGMDSVNIARYGVYLFVILSGFLSMYNYEERIKDVNLKSTLGFVKKKVLKFYPLFLIALIIKAPVSLLKYYYEFNGFGISFFVNSSLRLLSSLFLIQAFFPNDNYHFAFNGVSWFLDILIFCYFFTPLLVNQIKRISKKRALIFLIGLIVLQIIIQICVDRFVKNDYWYYIFPPYRFLDYLAGMLLCKILKDHLKEKNSSDIAYSIFEIIIIAINILFIVFKMYMCSELVYLLSLITIFVYIQNKGIISQKLNKTKIINTMCNINIELFLLHQPIIKYIEFVVGKVNICSTLFNVFATIVTFAIIVLISIILHKVLEKKQMGGNIIERNFKKNSN